MVPLQPHSQVVPVPSFCMLQVIWDMGKACMGTNYSTVHVASFPNFHVPRFHPMQYGMWSQLATGAGENKVAIYGYSMPSTCKLAETTDPVVWQLLSKLQVHLSITSSVKRLMYGNALNDFPSGTFDHKSYIKQHIETYSKYLFPHTYGTAVLTPTTSVSAASA